ncbi:MAG: hypothetical protein U1C33_00495, partial [Candidatus Cloacimonadaceae bacterium]|nr:hypothetical protein [Candidatus Cloacimonadaceae bacterium]
RCQAIYFNPLSRKDIEHILRDKFDAESAKARTASLIANGNMKTAIRIADQKSSLNRQIAIQILDMAWQKHELAFHNLISKDKEILSAAFIKELFNYMAILINDLVILRHTPDVVVNIDHAELLEQISSNSGFWEDGAYDMLLTLEDLKRKLDGHVNPNLVMINAFFGLSGMIHGNRVNV